MKTIEDLVKNKEWKESGTWCVTSEDAKEIARQHAEDYAKAFILWFDTGGHRIDTMDEANEALKCFNEFLNR